MKKILVMIAGAMLIAACSSPNREKEVEDIAKHELALSTIDIGNDDSEAVAMLEMYRKFAADFPEDSLTPGYLMRAAEMSINMGMIPQAISLIDTVVSLYPGYEDIAGCYFMKGYAYENGEQYDSAKAAYTYFVENYPDHYLANDTRKMLDYIGMTPEEMFEAVMNNANDKNLAAN
jgi:outer membrane protein assembly factor BamD (BamD/ComL family)